MALGGCSNSSTLGVAQWSGVVRAQWCRAVRQMDFAFSSKPRRGEVVHCDARGWGGLCGGRRSAQGSAASDRGLAATSRPCATSWASSHFELAGRTVPVGRPGYMTFPIIQRFSNAPRLKFKNIIFHTITIYETFWGDLGVTLNNFPFFLHIQILMDFELKI
jgi:hypothetical protein